ncbi:hypothetical protein HDU76_002422, partial [Blyttiomyces sp. JEL0837]
TIGFQYTDCPLPSATTNGNGNVGGGSGATATAGTGTTAGSSPNAGSSSSTSSNAVNPGATTGTGTTSSSSSQTTTAIGQVNPSTTGNNSGSSGSTSSGASPVVYAGVGVVIAIAIGVAIGIFVFMKRRRTYSSGADVLGKVDPKANGVTVTSTSTAGGVENHPWAGAAAVADKSNGPGTLFGNMPVFGGGVAIPQEKEPCLGYPAAGYIQQQPYYNAQFQPHVPQAPNYGNDVPVVPTTTATTSTFSTTSFPHDRKYNAATFNTLSSSTQDYNTPAWDTNTMTSNSTSFNIEADMTSKYGYFTTWTHEIILSWAQNKLGDDALQFITNNHVDGRLLNDVLNDSSLLSSVYGVGSGRTRNEILNKAELLRRVAGGSRSAGGSSGMFGNDEPAPPNYFDHAR